MKEIAALFATLAFLFIPGSIHARDTDKDGHRLVPLWKDFHAAEKSDRPDDKLSSLEKIIDEARARRYAWDYYDACERYCETKIMQDWKQYTVQHALFDRRIEEFGVPVAMFYHRRSEPNERLKEWIAENRQELGNGHNPEFYIKDYVTGSRDCGEVLSRIIRNDYDYVLWHIYFEDKSTAWELASAGYSAELQLLARVDALKDRYNEAERENAGQEEYLRLRDDCRDFIDAAGKLPGIQGEFASSLSTPALIIEQMEAESITGGISEGMLSVMARNTGNVEVTIRDKDKKTVYRTTLTNTKRSYCVPDTLKAVLPAMDDGEYDVTCSSGRTESLWRYDRYSLSMALKYDSEGYAVFVADQKSGEPLESCTLELSGSGETVTEAISLEDGFTRLPEKMNGEILARIGGKSKWDNSITASTKSSDGILLKSKPVDISIFPPEAEQDREDRQNAVILTDRGAYNPGDTVHFKAVLYRGYHSHILNSAGDKVTVKLIGARRETVSSAEFVTNEAGAVAGDFVLKGTTTGGMYYIWLEIGGKRISSKSIRVDEFITPTFSLEWDRMEDVFLPADTVRVTGRVFSYSGRNLGSAQVSCSVRLNGRELSENKLTPDASGRFHVDLVPEEDAVFQNFDITVKVVDGTGETLEFSKSVFMRRRTEPVKRTYFFEEQEGIALKVVAGSRPIWAVTELYGNGNRLIDSRLTRIDPVDGTTSAVISYDYADSFPDLVTLKVLYFQDGECHSYSMDVRRRLPEYRIPLEFTRFTDTAAPGAVCVFTIRTAAGTECAATVFDAATEDIADNAWNRIVPAPAVVNHAAYTYRCGIDRTSMSYLGRTGNRMMAKAANSAYAEEEAIPFQMMNDNGQAGDSGLTGHVRSNFMNTLAWEPFLHTDDNGVTGFSFRAADKLSTYYVQLFVHDRDFNNSVLRREMKVTLPVSISIMEPALLYEGDRYVAGVALSNNLDKDLGGRLRIRFLDGNDHTTAKTLSGNGMDVTVPAGGSVKFSFGTDCPEGIGFLGVLADFIPDDSGYGSDAVFISIPVRKASQTITEAHSAILFAGASRDNLISSLRSMFTELPGEEAAVREISILGMLMDAIPENIDVRSDNVLSLASALYSDSMLRKLGVGRLSAAQKEEIARKIGECLNSDGGYGWFKGMQSSPVVTAALLVQAKSSGFRISEKTVGYLDREFFNRKKRPVWLGGLTLQQYAYVRSLYSDVPFDAGSIDRKEFRKFRKDLKKYLVPAGRTGLEGQILAKARRILTLKALEGSSLASSWGIRANGRTENSVRNDMVSIIQYARKHVSGGWYYPNAVMPWRGLMESELHAHVLLCRLLESAGGLDPENAARAAEISEGIRLWIMMQKETQDWKSDPSYVEALGEVLKGSDDLLGTKVLALSATGTRPFGEIGASGNGFKVERAFFRNGVELKDGDTLRIGETIKAEYRIWNQENRSFVLLSAPRPACLRPVNQLSSCNGHVYVNKAADRTEFWYETFPEEDTVLTEGFHVTQEGRFQSPVITVESLYAPHYRANDKYKGILVIFAD